MSESEWKPPQPVDPAVARMLFEDARSSGPLRSEPVPEHVLRTVVERMRMGPSSMNLQALRLVQIESAEARAQLAALMSGGNRERVQQAPTVLVLAADADFHLHLPRTFPVNLDAQASFADAAARERTARDNAWLQAGFFIAAARSAGLAVGPMGGFDAAGVDRELLAGTSLRSFLVTVLGYPSGQSPMPRLPRLQVEELLLVR